MPSYVSNGGRWVAAKEKVGLIKKGKDPYIYEGADRAALFELYKAGVEEFGQDFRRDTEFLKMTRDLNFKTVNEYLKYIGYDQEAEDARFAALSSEVKKDDMPKAVAMIKTMGGGTDTSGEGNSREGGFGRPKPEV